MKLMILDGNSIVNRAFYGIRPLTTKDGTPTNAVYGFLNILNKLTEEEAPDYLTVAFDISRITFRNEKYGLYKAQRSGMPDELRIQMPILKEVLTALNIPYLELEGYEADDIIGTVSRLCNEQNIECKIATGDRDDLQLASELTTVKLVVTKGGRTETTDYNSDKVMEEYGITPTEFIDLKGLMGDASDNIPGVKGIGKVTALNLIKEFKSIDNLYDHLDSPVIKPAQRKNLTEHKDMAYLSKELATICQTVPLAIDFDALRVKAPDTAKLVPLFTRLEFKNLLKKFELEDEAKAVETVLISDEDELIPLLVKAAGSLFYLLSADTFRTYLDGREFECPLSASLLIALKPLFENPQIKKYSYDIKEQLILLSKNHIAFQGAFFDYKIAAYVLDPSENNYALDRIYYRYNGEVFSSLEELPALADNMEKKMDEIGVRKLYEDMELPLIPILAEMQLSGIRLDREELNRLNEKISRQIGEIEQRIYLLCGMEFNINSTKQLGSVLFETLGLPPVKKTKTGYSTDSEVLEKLYGSHEVIGELMEYRTLTKLKSTYIDAMDALVDEDSLIHSKFHQTVTQTGRLSSSDPNLQNIPVRVEIGRELRKMFVPVRKENVFVSADYSQIELRVLAQFCGDENLKKAFLNGEDIHVQAASRILDIPEEQVTPKMRSDAKAVNFGILYGKTDFSLAKDLGITRKEAKRYIDNYLDKYPNIRTYMETIVEFAKENGFVKTMLGRVRFIRELSDRNYMVRKFGERIALNTPIQGTAADIMKMAMIRVYNRLKQETPNAQLILQIHDELIIETPPEDCEKVKSLLQEEMENALHINVPLTVHVSEGKSLYELK